jgi:hypothetical protein
MKIVLTLCLGGKKKKYSATCLLTISDGHALILFG